MASQYRYDTFKDGMLVGDGEENMDGNSQSQLEKDQLLENAVGDDAVSSGGDKDGDDGAASTAFGAGSSRRDNGIVLTALLIVNYMIGAGIINAPQVFSKSGIGSATLLYIIAGLATWLGTVVLVVAAEVAFSRAPVRSGNGGAGNGNGSSAVTTSSPPEEHPRGAIAEEGQIERLADVDFAQLARETLGPYGSLSVDLAIVVQCFGDVASYVILISSLTVSLLKEWAGSAASGAWWSSFSVVAPLMVVLFVLPPSLIRHLSNLRWLSAFSFCVIISVVLLVVFAGSTYAAAERSSPDHDPGLDAELTWWDWEGSLAKLGSIVFVVAYAPAALHAYTAMNPRTIAGWKKVSTLTVGIGGFMCYIVGLMGYLTFRDSVNGDILSNFTGSVASVFKAVFVVHLSVYAPNEILVLRHSIYALKGGDVMTAPFGHVAFMTIGVLALIVIVVVVLDDLAIARGDMFGYIIDITGGVAISATSFVLPGLIYLGATSDEALVRYGKVNDGDGGQARYVAYRRVCKGLVVFGVAVMIVVPLGVAADIAGW